MAASAKALTGPAPLTRPQGFSMNQSLSRLAAALLIAAAGSAGAS